MLSAALAWRTPRWSLTLTVPAIRQEAPDLIHVGPAAVPGRHGDAAGGGGDQGGPGHGGGPGGGHGGGGPGSGGDGGRVSQEASGLGDPVLRLDVALPAVLPGGAGWGAFAAAKAPVASDDLGTGEWDAGVGLSAWRTGLVTDVYAELGYWTLGDPADLELDDAVAWRAYVTRRTANGRWAFAALTRGATEVADGVGSTAEAGVWIGRFLGGPRALGLTATVGLDDAAPDWTLALSWRLGVSGLRPETGP